MVEIVLGGVVLVKVKYCGRVSGGVVVVVVMDTCCNSNSRNSIRGVVLGKVK